jgi:hypothetical protein
VERSRSPTPGGDAYGVATGALATVATMASSSRPVWLVEALDVLDRRASLLRGVVLAVVLVGVLLAVVAPDVVPPQPLVGAAVAIVAILLGVAVTLAVDAGDGTVRGPRHVEAAGGELVGVLPTRVTSSATGDLADAVLDARDGRRVVLGVAAASEEPDVGAWTDALGVSLAARHASVLVVDLVGGPTPRDGLVEVVFEDVSLGHSVTFERDVKLARLGAGRNLDRAIAAAAQLPTRLPKDLEVLLVALPPVVDPEVINAVEALDAVLLIARSDATPRVRLQAAIEAVRTVGTTAQVVLVDDELATSPRPSSRTTPEGDRVPTGDEHASAGLDHPDGDPTRPAAVTTDLGAPRALDPGAAARATTADLGAVIAAGATDPVSPSTSASPEPHPDAAAEPAAVAEATPDPSRAPDLESTPAPDRTAAVEPTPDAEVRPEPEPEPVPASEPVSGSVPAPEPATEPAPEPAPGAVPPEPASEAVPPEPTSEPAGAPETTPAPAAPPAATGPRSITGRDVAASSGHDDPWTRPRTTPREELGRRPSPSVRVVRDLPPSARSPRPGVADQAPPLPPAPAAASPRDPDLVTGAAAAGLAARLSGPEPATPPAPPQEPAEAPDAATGPPDEVVGVEGVDEVTVEPDPASGGSTSVVEPHAEPEPQPLAEPEPELLAEPQPLAEPEPELLAEPEPLAEPAAETEAAVEPEPAPAVVEDDAVADPTDEIPAVRDARLARTAPEDDPLRTTAQLAMLVDELNGRDDEDDQSAP